MKAHRWRPWRGSWRNTLGRSLQGRLLGLFLLLALAMTVVFMVGVQQLLHSGWQSYVRPLVGGYADRLTAELGSPPDVAKAQALVVALPITIRIQGPLVQWDSQTGRDRAAHEHEGEEQARTPAAAGQRGWGVTRHSADGHRIRFGLARPPDEAQPRWVGATTLCALLLLTALAYATVRRWLAPLGPIAAGVAAYGRGEFGTPIPPSRRDELGALAERINGMAANLSGMLDAKRALLLAISHELRSPLTRARINAELVEDSPPRDALLRDLGEMRDLISSLLESERLTQGHSALQPEATDLPALLRDVVATQFKGAVLTLDLAALDAPMQADATRLRLLVRNLIDNALRHNAAAAPAPVVFLRSEADGRIALGVRDHGPDLPDEQIGQLGQAFYRPDSARTRGAGGVGLGLYLCRLVAQAHGGELRIRRAGPGLEVSALLPLSSAGAAGHC